MLQFIKQFAVWLVTINNRRRWSVVKLTNGYSDCNSSRCQIKGDKTMTEQLITYTDNVGDKHEFWMLGTSQEAQATAKAITIKYGYKINKVKQL